MPKFDVTLKHESVSYLHLSVTAKDEESAQDKIDDMLEACGHDPEKIAWHCKEEWEDESNTIEIDEIGEV